MPPSSRVRAQARQAEQAAIQADLALISAEPIPPRGLRALVAPLEGTKADAGYSRVERDAQELTVTLAAMDFETAEAVIGARDKKLAGKRQVIAFTLSSALRHDERLQWLDWTNAAYNAGSKSLQGYGKRAIYAADYMILYAICREAMLGIFARHLAAPADYELLIAPVRPYVAGLEVN